MKTTIRSLTCPVGTSGLAVEPWARGEIYAVAANWADASSPVMTYGYTGWVPTGSQVADYGHRAYLVLRAEIVEAIATSVGIPSDEVDDDEVDAIISDAVELVNA